MTSKDYKAIAEAIRSTLANRSDTELDMAYAVALNISDALKWGNPRFNLAKFLKACGFDQ